MAHPLLQRADIDAVLQVSSAERSFHASVDPDGAVVQFVPHGAVNAVEFAAMRDGL